MPLKDISAKRLRELRRSYLAHPSKRALRAYLRVKASRGTFDSRMFHYYAGIPENVVEHAKRAVRRAYARGLVVTATRNGTHSRTSLHPSGRATDFGLVESEIGTDRGRRRLVNFQRSEYEEWAAGNRPNLLELIGPNNNLIVLRGQRTSLPEGSPLENMHDNHVHLGWSE